MLIFEIVGVSLFLLARTFELFSLYKKWEIFLLVWNINKKLGDPRYLQLALDMMA